MRKRELTFLEKFSRFGWGFDDEKIREEIIKTAKAHPHFRFVSYIEKNYSDEWVEHIYAYKQTKAHGFEIGEVYERKEVHQDHCRNINYDPYRQCSCWDIAFESSRWHYYSYSLHFDEAGKHLEEAMKDRAERCKVYANADEILKCDELKYCAYYEECGLDIIDYIRLYKKYPIIEMVSKLKLFRWLNEKAGATLEQNKEFRAWTYKNAGNLKQMTFTTAYNSFKKDKNCNPSDYYTSLIYRMTTAKEICKGRKEVLSWLKRYTTVEKIKEYQDQNNVNADDYLDYCEAGRWLRLNFNDTKVLFPKEFNKYHDLYTRQYGEHLIELEAENSKSISNSMMETLNKTPFINQQVGNYLFIGAKSKEELIREGEQMSNCVGRMSYDKRQAEGKSIIVFLRKIANALKSYITIEIDPNDWKIKQCYGKNNSIVTDKDTLLSIDKWISILKRESKKLKEQKL